VKEQMGVVHGRFQLFHNDHLKYVLAAKERCVHMIIGICNPDMNLTTYSSANPHRSSLRENPFTYFERYQMIKGTLLELGISSKDFDIIPFPINYPNLIPNYAPMSAKYYMTIYDQWGREKEKTLRSIGCDIEIMWDIDISKKGISGSDIREMIRTGKNWKKYVPNYVYDYVNAHSLYKRIIEEDIEYKFL
jgi:hypothetical protein